MGMKEPFTGERQNMDWGLFEKLILRTLDLSIDNRERSLCKSNKWMMAVDKKLQEIV